MTLGALCRFDIVLIYSLKHILRETLVWPLSHWNVSLNGPILLLSNLLHQLVIGPFPKFRGHGDAKRIENMRFTGVVTQE